MRSIILRRTPAFVVLLALTIALLAGSTAAKGAASPLGLVAAYSFDAGAGTTLADASGQGNTGAISGATWTTAGKYGGALTFDGNNDFVAIADKTALDLSSGMTLEAWVKPSAGAPSWRTLLFKEHGNGMAYSLYSSDGTGRPITQVNIGGERDARGSVLTLNTWSHLAGTFDGSYIRLYLNGKLVRSLSARGSITASSGLLKMGGNSVWAEWFAGQIDNVRIYNRALSATELQSDMSSAVVDSGAPSDTQAPSTPGDLTVSSRTQTSITGAWTASTDNVGVTGYGRYQAGTSVGNGAGTGYSFTGLACGSSYALAVDAYDAAGNRSGQSTLTAATSACSVSDTSPPSTPQGLQVTSSSQTAVSIAWSASTDNVGVTGYGYYKAGVSAGNGSGTGYSFTGLMCGSSYPLSVDAYDAAGNRSAQSTITAATSACSASDSTPPSVPQGMQVSSSSQTGISIGWNASSDNVGVTGYRLYRNSTLVASTASLSYAFTGLTCGTTYGLGVAAFDAAGNASYLAEAVLTATTSACSTSSPPVNSAAPVVSGTAKVGYSVSSSNGSWSGSPSYSYQWRRCDTAGANCANISGANSSSYLAVTADQGATLRSQVTATNSAGSAAAASAQTAVVAAADATPPPASGNANVWIDTNGGTCVRQATATTYVDSAACGSFDAAYDRASPGDTVNIAGGSYGSQSINGDKGSTTPVIVQTAPNATVNMSGLTVSADYTNVRGPITVSGGMNVNLSDPANPVKWVVIDGVKSGLAYIENTQDVTIKNSEVGPNPGKILMQIGGYPETHRLTLRQRLPARQPAYWPPTSTWSASSPPVCRA